jgi:hypothetical protein
MKGVTLPLDELPASINIPNTEPFAPNNTPTHELLKEPVNYLII